MIAGRNTNMAQLHSTRRQNCVGLKCICARRGYEGELVVDAVLDGRTGGAVQLRFQNLQELSEIPHLAAAAALRGSWMWTLCWRAGLAAPAK